MQICSTALVWRLNSQRSQTVFVPHFVQDIEQTSLTVCNMYHRPKYGFDVVLLSGLA